MDRPAPHDPLEPERLIHHRGVSMLRTLVMFSTGIALPFLGACTRTQLFDSTPQGFSGLLVEPRSVTQDPEAADPLHVLLVHGISCQHLDWAATLQSNLIAEISKGSAHSRPAAPAPIVYQLRLGHVGIEQSQDDGAALVGNPLTVVAVKQVPLVRSDKGSIESPGTPCADEIASTHKQEAGQGVSPPDKVPDPPAAYIEVASYPEIHATFLIVTWSPIAEYVKAQRIVYESELCDPHGSGFRHLFSCRRAVANGHLKEDVVDSKLADAIVYLGARKSTVQAVVANALCLMKSDHPESEDVATECQHSVATSQATDETHTPPAPTGCPRIRFAFVTHSLGSRVLFDALTSDAAQASQQCLVKGTQGFYMLANQLPLLELTETDARGTIHEITEQDALGKAFSTWDDPKYASVRTVGNALEALQEDQEALQAKLGTLFSRGARTNHIFRADSQRHGNEVQKKAADTTLQTALVTEQGIQNTLDRQIADRDAALSRSKRAQQQKGDALKAKVATQKELDELANEALAHARNGRAGAANSIATVCTIPPAKPVPVDSQRPTSNAALLTYQETVVRTDDGAISKPYTPEQMKPFEVIAAELDPRLQEAHDAVATLNRTLATFAATRQTLCNLLRADSTIADIEPLRELSVDQSSLQGSAANVAGAIKDLSQTRSKLQSAVDRAEAALKVFDWAACLRCKREVQIDFAQAISAKARAALNAVTGELESSEPVGEQLTATLTQTSQILAQILVQDPAFWASLDEQSQKLALASGLYDRRRAQSLRASAAYTTARASAEKTQVERDGRSAEVDRAKQQADDASSKLRLDEAWVKALQERQFDPREEGMLALSALFDSQPDNIKSLQAQKLEQRKAPAADPGRRALYRAIATKLKSNLAPHRKIPVVAFSDPNDLLTFPIPDSFGSEYPDMQFANVTVRASWEILWILGDPVGSHTGHLKRPSIASLVVHGCNSQSYAELLNWTMRSKCKNKHAPDRIANAPETLALAPEPPPTP